MFTAPLEGFSDAKNMLLIGGRKKEERALWFEANPVLYWVPDGLMSAPYTTLHTLWSGKLRPNLPGNPSWPTLNDEVQGYTDPATCVYVTGMVRYLIQAMPGSW